MRTGSRGGTVSHRRLVRYLCNELIGACQTTEAGGRSIQEAFRDYRLVLDLMPDFDAAALQDLFRPVLQFPDAQNRDLLKTLVKAPLAEAVLGRAGIAPDAPAAQLTAGQLQEIAAVLQGFTLTVRGLKGWNEAQVTAGGVSEAEVDAGHMESALVPGLYFAGEVIGVRGTLRRL